MYMYKKEFPENKFKKYNSPEKVHIKMWFSGKYFPGKLLY